MPAKKIGIDLGTSSIKVFVKGKGIVLDEANAVSYDTFSDKIVAAGNSAKSMLERMPDTIELVMPIKSGVIADFSVMRQLLVMVIETVCKNQILRPDIIISAPAGITGLEKKTIIEVACSAGAGKVCIIDEPVASALGCAISIDKPHGVMVVDIGAGTSDIAVITMGTVTVSSSLKIAGDDFDDAICQYIKREKSILIGKPTAERIKKTIGCVYKTSEELEMSANGKDYVTGMPVVFTVTSKEICEALAEPMEMILEEVRSVLEQTPPELYSDICYEGIYLTGGSVKIRGIDKAFEERFKIKASVAVDCEHSAAKGAGYALKFASQLEESGYLFKVKEKDF